MVAALIAAAGTFLLRTSSTDRFAIPAALEGRDAAIVALVEKNLAAVASNPGEADLWMRLGHVYEANELDSLALENYQKALSIEVSEPRWWYRAARVWMRLGDRAGAMAAIERAIELHPRYAPLRWRLGLWHLDQGALEPARKSFERAIELDERDPAGVWGLARTLLREQRPGRAARVLEELVKKGPDHPYTHLLLGTAYRQLGRWQEARSELERGAGAAPVWRDPWDEEINAYRTGLLAEFNRAGRIVEMGKLDAGAALLEKLRQQYPDSPGVRKKLGAVYRKQGFHRRALEVFEEALAIRPEDVDLQFTVASVYAGLEDPARALEHLERAIALDPSQGRVYEGKGAVLAATGRIADAAAAFEQGLKHDPHNPSLFLRLGGVQCRLERWEEGLASFRRAAALDPKSAQAFAGIGKAAMKLGALDEAEEALKRAVAIQPGSSDIGSLLREVRRSRIQKSTSR